MANMRAVLGIDAAWTERQPTGVALAVEAEERWTLSSVTPSYDHFLAAAGRAEQPVRPTGSRPDATMLLRAAAELAGVNVTLVAIDMPLSHQPITCRRVADDAVSQAFGRKQCGTHSPSQDRPGKISDKLRAGFADAGYPLATTRLQAPALIEVYPHPALVELTGAATRLPYKAGKTRTYWPTLGIAERKERLAAEWVSIIAALEGQIAGVAEQLPDPLATFTGIKRKAFEDMLDAIVCAWVGIAVLDGRARSFGDADAAIWVPLPPDGHTKPA